MQIGIGIGITAMRSPGSVSEPEPTSYPLFPEGGLTSLAAGGYDPRDIEGTGQTDGSPTLTALTDYLDATPCQIAATANWHRVGFRNLAMANATKHTFCVGSKDVDAGQFRLTLQNDGLDSHTLTFSYSTGLITATGTAWGTVSNVRTDSGLDGTTYALFDYVPGEAVTAGRCAIGTGLANGSEIIVYTMDYSLAV